MMPAEIPTALVVPVILALLAAIGVLFGKWIGEQSGRRTDAQEYAKAIKAMSDASSAAALAAAQARLDDNKAFAASTVELVEKLSDVVDNAAKLIEASGLAPEDALQKPRIRRPGSLSGT